MFFTASLFCVVWGYSDSKEKAEQYIKQKTSLQLSYKTQMKCLACPGFD